MRSDGDPAGADMWLSLPDFPGVAAGRRACPAATATLSASRRDGPVTSASWPALGRPALTQSLLIGRGPLTGLLRTEYEIYRKPG
jgi:hypothetical protein